MEECHAFTLLLKMIADRGRALFSSMAELPLTEAQCRVVLFIEECGGGPVPQKAIERHLGISHTTAKGLLNRIAEKGFLRTAFDGADARVKNAYVTEKVVKFRESLTENLHALTERMLAGFTDGERKQLNGMLQRVYDNIR